jgi:S-adenosylhomocysteine hydrolase
MEITNYNYPLLKQISDIYNSDNSRDLKNTYILACQHLLEPQAKMFELFVNFGIPKQNIYIFGKTYSTSNEVVKELLGDGFIVEKNIFNPDIAFDISHKENCEKQFDIFLSKVANSSRIIILDDGGELLNVVNSRFTSIPAEIEVLGIEQTSSGFRKLENSLLHFPIFNVARSSIKLIKESPLIADLGCNRVIEVFNYYKILEPRILVVGLGPLGSNVVSALDAKGYFTLGYDISHHSASELVDLIKSNTINVVIGVTGAIILNEEKLEEIKNTLDYNLYLISMSSSDREFPAVFIRKNSVTSLEIHSDVFWDKLVLINNGFPITFKGNRYESTPKDIERTIGLLYGSVLQAITNDTSTDLGFIEVPKKVIDILEKHE